MKPSFNIAKTLNDYAKTQAAWYHETHPEQKSALQGEIDDLLRTIHGYGLNTHEHTLLLQRLVALLRVNQLNMHSSAYKRTARALIAEAYHSVA